MNVYLSTATGSGDPATQVLIELVGELGLCTWESEHSAAGQCDRTYFQMLYEEMQRADIFVGLYAYHYGWIPEKDRFGPETTDGERSLFEMEYHWAVQRRIPILIFFPAERDRAGNPVMIPDSAREPDPVGGQKLEALKEEIRRSHFIYSYHSLEHLKKLAGAMLVRTIHHQRYGCQGHIIFVSHSSKDDAFVSKLVRHLALAGLQPWIDHEHLILGADWDITIESALDAADSLLVVLTPDSTKSLLVKAEWSYFGETGKKVCPLLLKDTTIPFRLRVLQYVDFRENQEQGFKRLLEAFTRSASPVEWDTAAEDAPHP